MTEVLGIDIGATGIKGAVVDVDRGELITERIKYLTPEGGRPKDIRAVIQRIISDLSWKGPAGCGFPGIIKKGTVMSTANVSSKWMNLQADKYLTELTGVPFVISNDADLAGIAEVHFGKGKGVGGTLILITIGTGLGSAIFLDGQILPNTEMGHLLYKESIFEHYASTSARKKKNLSWQKWAQELSIYLDHLDLLFSPDLILLGGGVSKKFDKWEPMLRLKSKVKVMAAELQNNAGIIGAAMLAHQTFNKE